MSKYKVWFREKSTTTYCIRVDAQTPADAIEEARRLNEEGDEPRSLEELSDVTIVIYGIDVLNEHGGCMENTFDEDVGASPGDANPLAVKP